jgi:hypothetical protein
LPRPTTSGDRVGRLAQLLGVYRFEIGGIQKVRPTV